MARIYRNEILRTCFGPGAAPAQAADLARLNQIAERLAECEEVHGILRAKGHGRPGTALVDSARSVPVNVHQVLRDLFQRRLARSSDEINQAISAIIDRDSKGEVR